LVIPLWLQSPISGMKGLPTIARPDLAGWRRERLPNPWDVRPIEVVPDWICQVTSTSNAGYDRVTKRELSALYGVSHYWIADPVARTLETL
jgi:Uma2 family endonuclease